MRVLVTGGTGQLGRALTRALHRRGHTVRVLSRQSRPPEWDAEWAQGDLASGSGLQTATQEVDGVIHAASDPRNPNAVDVTGTTRLLRACRGNGVPHFAYVSIVGIDRIPLAYYGHKLEAERVIERGGVPHSILRVSQFHGFIDFLLRKACRVPLLLPVPAGVSIQSIAVEEVADRLCDIVEAPARGRLPDLVGPEELGAATVARVWVRGRKLHRIVVPVWFPGGVTKSLRRGHNVDGSAPGGGPTWAEWVASRYGDEIAV